MPTIITETFKSAAGANSPVDGSVFEGTDGSFATVRNAAGDSASASGTTADVSLTAASSSNVYDSLSRAIFCFNTSTLPDDAIIESATLYLSGSMKSPNLGKASLNICDATPTSTSTLAASDYSKLGTTLFSSVSYDNFSLSSTAFELNQAGRDYIKTNAVTAFGARLSWDRGNSFTGSWSAFNNTTFRLITADHATTGSHPRLEVSYSLPELPETPQREPEVALHSKLYTYDDDYIPGLTKIWDGSAWVYSKPRMYDGTGWRDLL